MSKRIGKTMSIGTIHGTYWPKISEKDGLMKGNAPLMIEEKKRKKDQITAVGMGMVYIIRTQKMLYFGFEITIKLLNEAKYIPEIEPIKLQ
ncbi:hypothetical protein [Methanolapillus ohkumae]|uniref:hypothetical protein n=1 Tax=Methanolapillus ohkumae TaxID=3028298 RepID=UPI0030B8C1B8